MFVFHSSAEIRTNKSLEKGQPVIQNSSANVTRGQGEARKPLVGHIYDENFQTCEDDPFIGKPYKTDGGGKSIIHWNFSR